MRRTISCCKDCDNREIGCHSTCEKYIKEKKVRDDEKIEIHKNMRKDRFVTHTLIENKRRIKKMSRH